MAPKPKYKVGYRKPPKGTQFQKGVSGNSRGRPKGSLNVATVLERTSRELITINVNGKRKQITKLEAAAMQVSNKSASGDLQAAKLMFALLAASEEKVPEGQSKPLLNSDDKAVISRLLARQERKIKTNA